MESQRPLSDVASAKIRGCPVQGYFQMLPHLGRQAQSQWFPAVFEAKCTPWL